MPRKKQKFHKGDLVKVVLHHQILHGRVLGYKNKLVRVWCFGDVIVGVYEEDLLPEGVDEHTRIHK